MNRQTDVIKYSRTSFLFANKFDMIFPNIGTYVGSSEHCFTGDSSVVPEKSLVRKRFLRGYDMMNRRS
jgi:hypothetical protein